MDVFHYNEGNKNGGHMADNVDFNAASAPDSTGNAAQMTDAEGNLLKKGKDELEVIKGLILTASENEVKSREQKAQAEKLDDLIKEKEKNIETEVTKTKAKRKNELSGTFDEQTDKVKDRLKGVVSKKGKAKNKKIDIRIKEETAGQQEKISQIKNDIKQLYRAEKMPRIFNNGYFQSICQPIGIGSFFAIFITIVIVLVVIPFGVFYFFLPKKALYLAVMYIASVVLFGSFYLFVNQKTKVGHPDAFAKLKALRLEKRAAKKEIRRIIKKIRKDKDESTYGLDELNAEINSLNYEIEQITANKKLALKEFEEKTCKDVEKEIVGRYESEISKMKEDYKAAYDSQRFAEDTYRKTSLSLSKEYATYMGKDMLSISKIEALEKIIDDGRAATIGDAINILKENAQDEEK